jgi:DNA-binding NarL/FixJ family response regulator
MLTTLTVRRTRGFLPQRYSPRHRAVAELLAAGSKRQTIAELTGYSASHISRIAAMPQVRSEIARILASSAVLRASTTLSRLRSRQQIGR